MPLTIKNIINNIAFTTSHEVDEICKPLQEFFGIDFFAYEHDFRNINDDRITASSYLCSNPQALEFAFSCPKLHHEDQQLQKRAERYYFLENRAPVFVNQLGKTCNVRYIFCRSDHLGNNETDFLLLVLHPQILKLWTIM